ncbi:MAG: DUF1592 domain-containing protein [Verrucomicrobiales bacterium]|nr:DUF1592 domain-containing protein [Verrucomicrobiales bacterium]
MRISFTVYFYSAWAVLMSLGMVAAAENQSDAIAQPLLEDLRRFCFECHGEKEAEKDLRLDVFLSVESVLKEKALWNRVLTHIREQQMPPDEAELVLPEAKRVRLIAGIEKMLQDVDWQRYRRPGRVLAARLTRVQYRNTMRDLLGLDLHPHRALLEDGEGRSGFRNDRGSLSMSGAEVGKYFAAAEQAVKGMLELAFAESSWSKASKAVDMQRSMENRMKPQAGVMILANPGQELSIDCDFPVDAYYRVELQASPTGKDTVALMRIDGELVGEVTVSAKHKAEAVIFVSEGRHSFSIQNKNLFPVSRQLPLNVASLAVQRANEKAARFLKFANEDAGLKTKRKAYNQRAAGVQEAYEWLRLLGVSGDPREIDRFRSYAGKRELALERARDELAVYMGLPKAELRRLWVEQNQQCLQDNQQLLSRVAAVQWGDWMKHQGKIAMRSVTVRGPVFPLGDVLAEGNLLQRMRKWDHQDGQIRSVLEYFLSRAFRRSLAPEELHRYLSFYRQLRAENYSSQEAMRLTLTAILTSPEFLFHEDRGTPSAVAGVERLDAWSLASRLSYFLWSSMPDAPLLGLARSGDLQDDAVLSSQVDRILDSDRAEGFYRSFAGQWLGIDSLGKTVKPDAQHFPEFTDDLAEWMKEETFRSFEYIFSSNRPLTELLDADWAFLNQRLAQHYGIKGTAGDSLRRVVLSDKRRGGLLGMGSVLTVTSSPSRTNPMRRGFWVLEGLLGDRLGEPPGDAGELPGDAGEARGKSLREEIELHRTRESCMSCHVKLDPLGFGLQNFDAIGRWRDEEAGKPVDSSGVMPDGRKFDGPVELKQVLMEQKDVFVKNLCGKMLAYALGRPLEFYDEAEVRRIFEQVKKEKYHSRTLIREVVNSYPFRFREVED